MSEEGTRAVMYRFIHSFALAAALVALVASLWQGWGTVSCLKRMIVSYLGFFFLGGILAILVRSVSLFDAADPKADSQRNRPDTPEVDA